MRKSVLAMAAVAAMGAAGAANASFFQIRDASYSLGGTPTVLGNFVMDSALVGSVINTAGATDVTVGGSASTVSELNNAAVGDIITSIGANGSGNARMTYFSMYDSVANRGYFGFVFENNATARDLTVSMGNANLATGGVFTNYDGSNSGFGGGTFQSVFGLFGQPQLAANATYIAIFAGVPVGTEIGAGTVSDQAFSLQYLDWTGTGWNALHSAEGVTSSSLNYATYSIPVPAPMLLAGAGLIGAAALRRRMVKKA